MHPVENRSAYLRRGTLTIANSAHSVLGYPGGDDSVRAHADRMPPAGAERISNSGPNRSRTAAPEVASLGNRPFLKQNCN